MFGKKQLQRDIEEIKTELRKHPPMDFDEQLQKQVGGIEAKLDNLKKYIDVLKNERGERDSQYDTLIERIQQLEEILEKDHLKWWHMQFAYDRQLSDLVLNIAEKTVENNRSNLSKFRNLYKNKRCFVIGNGPSLRIEDLEKIRNEYTFAVNKINMLFSKTDWRPTFYFCTDTLAYSKKVESYCEDCKKVFLPIDFISTLSDITENMIFYPFIRRYSITPEFSSDPCNGIYEGGTVVYAALQFAVFMGFSEIYLLGVDCDYPMKTLPDGRKVVDFLSDSQAHFYPADQEEKAVQQSMDSWMDYNNAEKLGIYEFDAPFRMAKYICDENRIKIYNATRGGKLEIFPRVLLENIL